MASDSTGTGAADTSQSPGVMDRISSWAKNAASGTYDSLTSNPGAWARGLGIGASVVNPAVGGLFNSLGAGFDMYKSPQQSKEYIDAMDAWDRVKEAKKNPDQYQQPSNDPESAYAGKPMMPTLTDQQKAAITRGAPQSQEKLSGQVGEGIANAAKARIAQRQAQMQAMPKPEAPKAGGVIHGPGTPFLGGVTAAAQAQQAKGKSSAMMPRRQAQPVQQAAAPSMAQMAQMLVQGQGSGYGA